MSTAGATAIDRMIELIARRLNRSDTEGSDRVGLPRKSGDPVRSDFAIQKVGYSEFQDESHKEVKQFQKAGL